MPRLKLPKRAKQQQSAAVFAAVLRAAQIPLPVEEHRFHAVRRWRFDYAWPDHRVALEIEGGIWTAGRHTRPSGFVKDMEKYNTAASCGWLVLRCTPQTLTSYEILSYIRAAIQHQEERGHV